MSFTSRAVTAVAASTVGVGTSVGVALHLATTGSPAAVGVTDWWLMAVAGAVAYGGTGTWLSWARPGLNVAWVLLSIGVLCALSMVALEYGVLGLERTGMPLADLSLWLGNWVWAVALLPVAAIVPLLLPDGRLPSTRWAFALGGGVLSVVAAGAQWALTPYGSWSSSLADAGAVNPVGTALVTQQPAATVLILLVLSGPVLGSAALVARWRRASGTTRQQLKWILMGVAATLALFAGGFVAGPTVTALAMLPLPSGIVVAVLRYGLWKVDVVIGQALVYAALMVCVVLVYVTVVGLLGGLLGRTTGAPILATALVAVAVEPLHRRLRGLVNKVLHGSADDPLTALSRLGSRLESAQDPSTVAEQLLPELVGSAATSLHLPYVGVVLVDGTGVHHGTRESPVEELPLRYAGNDVGRLVVSPAGATLDRRTRSRLTLLAGQVSVAAHSVLLAHALSASREEAVRAREEERRRLYRDLHDGLGPALAALALNVEAAREALGRDHERTAALLDRVLPRLKATVSEVRGVVHGLRPEALDDLGLTAAVGELAAGFTGPRLSVRLEAEHDMSGLPAATEVAAYRIVAEALSNVSRHAQARHAVVTMVRDGEEMHLNVQDDGRGLGPGSVAGIGLASMTRRAQEVGGRLGVGPGVGGRGTSVFAVLPGTVR
jgi:two-component system NarL family sensor kinase